MAVKEYLVRVRHKRDTSVDWTANNPVPLDGEIIVVITAAGEVRKKFGDGISRYTQLPFEAECIKGLINDRVAISQGADKAEWNGKAEAAYMTP